MREFTIAVLLFLSGLVLGAMIGYKRGLQAVDTQVEYLTQDRVDCQHGMYED